MECARVLFLVLVYVLTNFSVYSSCRRLGWAIDDEGCRTPDYGVGTCIRIDKCSILINFIESNDDLSDRIINEIREYACGYDRQTIKVCCPSKLPAHWTVTTQNDDEDYSRHKNIKLLAPPDTCGRTITTPRITNGNVTELFEFPWAVVLKYQREINPYSCGASLISKRYVLTAAHCIRSKNKLISVRLGEYNFTTAIDCEETFEGAANCAAPPQDFDISVNDAIVHPGYNETTLVNDIAIIRLPRDAVINGDSVNPICLPITKNEVTKVSDNYVVIGWGATETGFASKVLLKVFVPLVKNSVCAPIYAARVTVTENQLCAGGKKEQDSCAGDSGGPLSIEFTAANESSKSIQYGIVSFGPRICGRENFPAVYTKVSKYVEWILNNMKE